MKEKPIDKDILLNRICTEENAERLGVIDNEALGTLASMLNISSGRAIMKMALENPVFVCAPHTDETYQCEIELTLNDRILFRVCDNDSINIIFFNADKYIPVDKLSAMGFHSVIVAYAKKYYKSYEKYIEINKFNKELLDFMDEYGKSEFMHSHAKTEIELIKEYLEMELE